MPFFFDREGDSAVTQSDRVLHTPTKFAREALFYVQEAGTLFSLRPHVCRREKQRSYLFVLVREGEGRFRAGGEERMLRAGEGAFVDCMDGYEHESSARAPWRLMWVHFYGRSLPRYYEQFRAAHNSPFVALPDAERFADLIETVVRCARETNARGEIEASAALHELVSALLLLGDGGEQVGKLSDVRAYLDAHFAEPVTLDALSALFFVSKFHLSRTFSARFGMTIGEYLTKKRITEAKRLLRFTDGSVADIAKAVGVSDANYFNKVFQKTEGLSPSAFRKQW